jgi:diguanylate cyclase (GGDEF)-like protein
LFLIYYLKEIENKMKEKENKIDELSSKLRFFDALKLRKEELYKGIKETSLPEEPYSLFKRLLNYLSDTYFEIYKPQTLLFLFYDNIKRGFRVEAGNSKVLNLNLPYLIDEDSPLISLGIKQKKTIFLSEGISSGEKLGIYKESGIYVGSFILTPIIHEGNLYGFIYIDSNEINYFPPHTKEIFEKIAKKISIMLKFFFELKDKKILAQRYRALFELAMETGGHIEKKEIFEKIFKICKNMFEINIFIFSKKINENTAEIFYIFDEKGIIKEKYIYLNEDSLFSFAYQNEYPLIFKRIKRETFILNKGNYGIRSAIFVPLKINKGIEYVFSILSFSRDTFSDEDKEIINFLKNQCEIVLERTEIYEREKERATKDSLTGLFNHRMFHQLLEERIKKGSSFTLVMMDIDDFKKFNDFYGHPAGDKILLEISKILKENVEGKGFCARYGGEEFAICFDLPKDEGIRKCEEIRKLIENWEFYIDDATKINITASFGIAGFPDDDKKKNLLIEKADKALYLAKRKGKNRVYVYKKEEVGLF